MPRDNKAPEGAIDGMSAIDGPIQAFKMTIFFLPELLALADSQARFVVVGAVALGLHNYPRATADLDILPALDPENLEKIISVLRDLAFKPHIPMDPRDMLDSEKREAWHRDKHLRVVTFYSDTHPPHVVDVMIYPPVSYEKCAERQMGIELQGRRIFVASIDDLLFMKKSAMRAKDLSDIMILEQLKADDEEQNKNG